VKLMKWKSSFTPQIPSSSIADPRDGSSFNCYQPLPYSCLDPHRVLRCLDVSALGCIRRFVSRWLPLIDRGEVLQYSSVSGKRIGEDEAKPELHKEERDSHINPIVLYV
jgi:hypothetical protein